MKKNILSTLAGLSVICMLFSSCSSVKQNTAFSERKYYNFKHHDPIVVLNTHKERTTASTAPKQALPSVTIPQIINTAVPKITLNETHKNLTKNIGSNDKKGASANVQITKAPANTHEELSNYIPAPAKEMAPQSEKGGKSSVDPVILILLAIFLSPLAVYLYDSAATTRFWIDLILWIIGVGFGFGIFLFIGLAWLVAVIYAILIVTGSV